MVVGFWLGFPLLVLFVGCWCSCSCGCRLVGVWLWLGLPLVVLFVGCWCSCSCSSWFVGVGFWEGGRQRSQGKDEDGEEDTLGHFEGRR